MYKDAFHVFVESLRRATPPQRRTRGLKLEGCKIMSHESPIRSFAKCGRSFITEYYWTSESVMFLTAS